MVLISKNAYVGLSSTNVEYYRKLGYEIPEYLNKFGKLVYIKGSKIKVRIEDLPKRSTARVLCNCDICGKDIEIKYYGLFIRKNNYENTKTTVCKNCSMANVNFKHGDEHYSIVKAGAKYRGIDFKLTLDEFKSIVMQKCHYCNEVYDGKYKGRNGIDRIDSSKGYVLSNCVPCCATCNSMKLDTDYDEFLNNVKYIYKHMNLEDKEEWNC